MKSPASEALLRQGKSASRVPPTLTIMQHYYFLLICRIFSVGHIPATTVLLYSLKRYSP